MKKNYYFKTVILSASMLVFGTLLNAQTIATVPLSEDFNYATGGNIPANSNHIWNLDGQGDEAPVITTKDMNLSHPIFKNNEGSAISLTTSAGKDLRMDFFTSENQHYLGTFYVSMLINVKSAPNFTGDDNGNISPFMSFVRGESTALNLKAGKNGNIYAKQISADKYKLGVVRFNLNAGSPNAAYADMELSYNTTYHVIFKANYVDEIPGSKRVETISLYIEPNISGAEPTEALAHQSGTMEDTKYKVASAIKSLLLIQELNSPTMTIDRLRIAKNWDELGFSKEQNSTGINNSPESKLQVIANNGSIEITNIEGEDLISLYNSKGMLVGKKSADNNGVRFTNLEKGLYIVKGMKQTIKVAL